jgi:hypothetical protein
MRSIVAGAALAVFTTPAFAQSLPDIGRTVTQGAQVEDAVARSTADRNARIGDDETIDGEAGIFVLREADIFYISGTAGLGYATNPLRTADDAGASWSAEARVEAGVQTVLGGKVDFSLAASYETTRYFESFAPSNSVASANASLGTAIGNSPFYASVAGFGGWNFDRDLNASQAFYGVSGQINGQFPLGRRTLLQPQIVASRVMSEISENNLNSLGARLTLLTVRGRISLSASASVSRLWYDDFFEDVTFVPRRDWQYDVGVTAAYRLSQRATIAASARYTRRDSSFFLSSHQSLDGGAALSFRVAF